MSNSQRRATNLFAFLIVGIGILLLGALSGVFAQETSTRDVMRSKLHCAQGVLEAIATENYGLLQTNALKLKYLSQQASWQVRQTPEYQQFTMEFARNADRLAKAAEEKNVDAATVAYFQMTVSCTTCHKYLRGAKTAKLDPTLIVPSSRRRSAGP